MGLPDGGRTWPGGGSPQEEKVHTLEALIELLQRLSEQQPVLFLVEDAHWIDPSTEEFIAQVAQRVRDTRVLLLVTCRPEYTPSWGSASQLTRHSLNRLSNKQCAALVNALTAGKALPAEVLAEIIRKTDGIPLFVEELTKTVLQSGLLEDTPSGYQLRGPLSTLAIPATLQDSLMARLDRLAPAKEVAQVGAVIGREFGHRLMAEVLSDMPAPKLDAALADLVRSELVFRRGTPPDATYSFKHALVRDTAYNSMLKSQRVLRHRQIAVALEQADGDAAAAQPELLAYHHQEGGNAGGGTALLAGGGRPGDGTLGRARGGDALPGGGRAAGQRAGRRALRRSRAWLAVPTRQRGVPDRRVHLASRATRATPEPAISPRRSTGPMTTFRLAAGWLHGLNAAGRFGEAIALLERFGPAELARLKPMSRVNRLYPHGLFRGRCAASWPRRWSHLAEARRELENVRPEDWQPLAGADPLVAILMYLSQNLMRRGLLSSADACVREGLGIAEQRQHSNSRVWALYHTAAMSGSEGRLERCDHALHAGARAGGTLRPEGVRRFGEVRPRSGAGRDGTARRWHPAASRRLFGMDDVRRQIHQHPLRCGCS